MVLPLTSIDFAPDGIDTSPRLPTALMRLFSTTTTPSSITWVPSIVRILAPTSAVTPFGTSAFTGISITVSLAASALALPSSAKKSNFSASFCWYSVGPNDQDNSVLSSDQARFEPANVENFWTGKLRAAGPVVIALPLFTKGVT